MKLRIFQSDKGDCLFLSSSDGKNMLIDGGMSSTMKEYVRSELPGLVGDGGVIEYAYISHIDQDHISGVLALLQDVLEWKVHDFHVKRGDTSVRAPSSPRPPAIKNILHNAFHDQVGKNRGDLADMLAAAGRTYLGTSDSKLQITGEALHEIALSIKEAIQVSSLVSAELLNIPVNRIPGNSGGKLIFIRDEETRFKLGTARITVVGPTRDELSLLRKGWNNWLRDNETAVKQLREKQREQIERFAEGELSGNPFDLRDWNGIDDYKGVTVPNIASLMLMVEEDGKRLLLTGDSQQDIILKGLELTGYLPDGFAHLDVLKVQHHGSENNTDKDFCRKVSADHYIFCGNGEHGNPELSVIQQYFDSRFGSPALRTLAPEAQGRKCHFWFSTSSDALDENAHGYHEFVEAEKLAKRLERKSNGLLKLHFNKSAFQTLEL